MDPADRGEGREQHVDPLAGDRRADVEHLGGPPRIGGTEKPLHRPRRRPQDRHRHVHSGCVPEIDDSAASTAARGRALPDQAKRRESPRYVADDGGRTLPEPIERAARRAARNCSGDAARDRESSRQRKVSRSWQVTTDRPGGSTWTS